MFSSLIHSSGRRVALAIAATALTAAAAPALAQACTVSSAPLSQPLKSLGDANWYQLVPGGSFESGSAGWTLKGASVASGSESYRVGAASDSHSLAINAIGSAVSPPICVSLATPMFRFFARQTSGSWAQMNVNMLWTDSAGVVHSTTAGSLNGSTSWAASPVMALGSSLPLWQAGQTISLRLQFLPAQYGGNWAIDDVYIDPYSKR